MNLNMTISLPASIASRIENDKGELSRSKFVAKLLEVALSSPIETNVRKKQALRSQPSNAPFVAEVQNLPSSGRPELRKTSSE